MIKLAPSLVRRAVLPASFLAFLTGTIVSAAFFYTSRPFDVKAAVLSDLQSPDDNPNGYGASAAGTALSAILLVPAIAVFYQQLRRERAKLALAGTVMFAVALVSAIAIGALAPFTHDYTPLHIQLASAVFIGLSGGTWFHLLAARAAPALFILQLIAFLVVVFLCYGPVHFDSHRLLTSLAFWEWALCTQCGAALWVLAGEVERNAAAGPTRDHSV